MPVPLPASRPLPTRWSFDHRAGQRRLLAAQRRPGRTKAGAAMMTLNLGPLAVPLAPFLALVALLLTSWSVRRVSRPAEREAADAAVWWAGAVGFLAARLAHVLTNASAYAPQPLSMLDIRDGGFQAWAGVAAGGVFLLWRVRRGVVDSRRAVVATAAGGVVLWLAVGQLVLWFKPAPGQHLDEVAVTLQDLDAPRPGLTLAAIQAAAGGRPVIVNLWATWCPPCRAEMPVLARAQREHPEVLIVLVNQGESSDTIRNYLARERLAVEAVWRDPSSALGPALGSGALPTTVVFDAQGRRVQAHVGMVNEASLRLMIRAVQPSRP